MPDGRWSEETRGWWRGVWRSPMAAAFLPADVPVLARLAGLRQDFVESGDVKVLPEIRQLEDRFGMSPRARQQLHWEVVAEESERPATVHRLRQHDPRLKLAE